MKIYSKIVIDMETGGTIAKEWTDDYTGPIAHCGGGSGGGSGGEPDYAYNKRMADISEINQGHADEMFNLFKHGVTYDPSEKSFKDPKTGQTMMSDKGGEMTTGEKRNTVQREDGTWWHPDLGEITVGTRGEDEGFDPDSVVSEMDLMQNLLAAQDRLIPAEENLRRTQLETETGLTPLRGKLEEEQIGSARRLLPGQEKLAETQNREGELLTRERSGVMQSLYKSALDGVDVEGRVGEHRAGVEHAFKNQQNIVNRNLSRMGIDPSSGRGLAASENIGLEKAKATSLGETQIRRGAETENFERKKAASGLPI